MTRPVIVADASPLIALATCDRLGLLSLVFGEVQVPAAVLREAAGNLGSPGAMAVAEFVRTCARVRPDPGDALARDLRTVLGDGESQALSLARALGCGVLLDDRRARGIAAELGIPVVGILGVLLRAKRLGLIGAVKPILDELVKHQYRLSTKLIAEVLARAGE